jgi:hypothetical protein
MGANFSRNTGLPEKFGSLLFDRKVLQIEERLAEISTVRIKPPERKVANMEVELTLINEIMEKIFDKVDSMKEEPCKAFVALRNQCQDLQKEFDSLAHDVTFKDDMEKRSMQELTKVDNDCVKIKEDIVTVVPSWGVPQEPLPDDEVKSDFSHYADHLSERVEYLMGLHQAYPDRIFNYATHLYGLRKRIDDAVQFYRHSSTKENFYAYAALFRNKLHNFGTRVDDICERYLESKSEKGEDSVDG